MIKLSGKPINDSHRGMRIIITKGDIENGQPNDPCSCAAARAIKRTLGAKRVAVFRNVTYIVNKDEKPMRFRTSPALRLETIVFDRNGSFYPGEYDLLPMPIGASMPAKKKGGGAKKRKGSNGGSYHVVPNVRPTASHKIDI